MTAIIEPVPGKLAAADAPPEQLVQLGKALADPLRLRALRILAGGPRTLGDLAAELGVPRTTLAHHIAVLRAAGLLSHTVEDGRWGRLSLRADAVADVEPLFRGFVTPPRSRRS
jgi:DNA-binding transcriptional ArsR family regulator